MKKLLPAILFFLLLSSTELTYGQIWSNAGNSYVCPYGVNTVLSYNNDLYAGGVTQITKWNGTTWTNVVSVQTVGVDQIWCMAVYNGELYIGGDFSFLGIPASYIVKWDGTSFSAVGGGLTNIPGGLGEYNGELYAFGYNGLPLYNGDALVKWNGTAWSPVGTNTTMTGSVSDMLVHNGELYVCGYFTAIGGIAVNNIAKWNGTAWSALGLGTNWYTNVMTVYNNELYAGGYFTGAGGLWLDNIAKWDGSSWLAVGGGILGPSYGSSSAEVNAMAVFKGELYVAGEFSMAGSTPAWNIAKWNGSSWQDIGGITGGGVCGGTYGMGVFNNNELFVGGLFDSAGTIAANNIAIYSGEGSTSVPLLNSAQAGLSVFPNPAVSDLTIGFDISNKDAIISIVDMTGKIIYSIASSETQTLEVNVKDFAPGVYFVQMHTSDFIETKKLIIVK